MAGPAPTTLTKDGDRSAGPVHSSGWLFGGFPTAAKRGIPTVLNVRLVALLKHARRDQLIEHCIEHVADRVIRPEDMLRATPPRLRRHQAETDSERVAGAVPVGPVGQRLSKRPSFHASASAE